MASSDRFQGRLAILTNHLQASCGVSERDEDNTQNLEAENCSRSIVRRPVSTMVLADYMAGPHRALKEKIFHYFQAHPELQVPVEISKKDHRVLCLRQLLALVRDAGVHPFRALLEDPSKYFEIAEAVGAVDLSLAIKMGVQFR